MTLTEATSRYTLAGAIDRAFGSSLSPDPVISPLREDVARSMSDLSTGRLMVSETIPTHDEQAADGLREESSALTGGGDLTTVGGDAPSPSFDPATDRRRVGAETRWFFGPPWR